ncbi:hypothetical protein GDO81_010788 [Engystomops pustulosus]|uniref:Securin n=1 Tax=Engystomops pustulosus TaxID=76066 RepID=A0AAV7C2T7_ENGPU|nr:hypothetical protein GDO81_010788 [Engystomops pustulosus]
MEAFMLFEKENDGHYLPTMTNKGLFAQLTKGALPARNAKNLSRPQARRKALGNVNQQVPSTTKPAKRNNSVKQTCEEYPEVETFIPYNPLDFENCNLPQEHKLSDLNLAGVPLFVSKDDMKLVLLVSPVFSPMESSAINYDSFEPSIPQFEDFTIDLPLCCI